MSSDFMPLSLDTLKAASAYSTAKSSSSSPTTEELKSMGYTISDPNEDLGLDFSDFLSLMVSQLQNQTIDNAADTSDMLNQLVQMSVVQMMSTVKTGLDTLTEATSLTYAASLVGKTVTVASYDAEGNLEKVEGTVTGTGTYQGMFVIFVDGEMYALNSIMAVGSLPDIPEEGGDGEGGEGEGEGGEGEGGENAGGESTQQI